MKLIMIREIIFIFLVALQFSVVVYYRIKASRSNRQLTTGKRDQWLLIRNGLIIFTVSISFYSIDTILRNPLSENIAYITTIGGSILWLSSILLYIWSRNTLNTQFNSSVVIYEDHKLITSGPYSISRHPIYLSYLGAFMGVTLLTFSLFTAIGGAIGAIWML